MSKFSRKKIAITLAFAALFGNNTSAMNTSINKHEVKNPQTLGAVEGANTGSQPMKDISNDTNYVADNDSYDSYDSYEEFFLKSEEEKKNDKVNFSSSSSSFENIESSKQNLAGNAMATTRVNSDDSDND